MKKQQKKQHKEQKSHFMWALVGIFIVLFLMFFINGYLVHQQTGIDDTDTSIFQR